MTDIVARLRRLQNAWKDDVGEAYGKAADEIERLRRRIDQLEFIIADMERRQGEP